MYQARKLNILFALTSTDDLLWRYLSQGTPGPELSPRGGVSLTCSVSLPVMPGASPIAPFNLPVVCLLSHSANLPAAPSLTLGVESVSAHCRAELLFYR